MALKEKLRELLDLRGMKQAELAEKAELSEAIVSNYLSGKREPKGTTCAKLAQALGVTVDELLETGLTPDRQLTFEQRQFIDELTALDETDFSLIRDIFHTVQSWRKGTQKH